MATEMGYLEFGNEIGLALFPAELYPEVFWDDEITGGANWDGTQWPYDSLADAVEGVTIYPISITNDALGYVVPDNDYTMALLGDHYQEMISLGEEAGSTAIIFTLGFFSFKYNKTNETKNANTKRRNPGNCLVSL